MLNIIGTTLRQNTSLQFKVRCLPTNGNEAPTGIICNTEPQVMTEFVMSIEFCTELPCQKTMLFGWNIILLMVGGADVVLFRCEKKSTNKATRKRRCKKDKKPLPK